MPLHEKSGKQRDLPAHDIAEEYMNAYLDAAGIRIEPNFRMKDVYG